MKKEERKAVSKMAIVTSGIVLVVFAIAGTGILRLFGITIFSFMIAGGVLLFIVAIELLTHGVWRFGGGALPGESGVVPLAFPLLAGPGAITSVIISYQATGFVITIFSIAIVIGITYIILLFVNPIYRLLGRWFYDSQKSICNFYSSHCNTVCNRRCQATFRLKDTSYVLEIKNNLYSDIFYIDLNFIYLL